ncbi:hypothetical protein [Plantactinospora sonchi]|uniref:DUF4345 domain-containing protein n=1 Tax=Plantactinospora sonchi TaxID=1544735 RepID=A0ABU7RZ26_9ACTN
MILRISTWVFGLGLLLIGVAAWLVRTPYGVHLTERDTLAELNAVIVGLHLAVGASILIFALCRLHLAGLLLATLTVTGLAGVRTAEMAIGDAATARQWILLAPEVAGILLGTALLVPRLSELRAPSRADRPAPPSGQW